MATAKPPPKGWVPKGPGARMKERRQQAGVTRKAMAAHLGISVSELEAAENDRRAWDTSLVDAYITGCSRLRRY